MKESGGGREEEEEEEERERERERERSENMKATCNVEKEWGGREGRRGRREGHG